MLWIDFTRSPWRLSLEAGVDVASHPAARAEPLRLGRDEDDIGKVKDLGAPLLAMRLSHLVIIGGEVVRAAVACVRPVATA